MNAPGNRPRAARERIRSVMSSLVRERYLPGSDQFVRRGGGFSWSRSRHSSRAGCFRADLEERCFQIARVASSTTGKADEPGPVLLV